MKDSGEISALISLLDDPDDTIYLQIKEKLISIGEEIIPSLETAWENNSFGVTFQTRVEDIIHQIQFDGVFGQLKAWKENGAEDLLEGMLLVNKYQYPDLDEAKLRSLIDQLKQDVWIELNDELTAFEQVRVINHILFEVHGYSGNKKNFHAPQNSYLNNVLDSKKGNPLSLSILYILVAKEVNVPIYGINLPNHFVLAYVDQNNIMQYIQPGEDHSDILFYINPFSRGTVFNRKEIEQFLEQIDAKPNEDYFNPCDNLTIIRRVITNLIFSYEKLGYPDKIEELQELKKALA
jgi:regulator of sirC expression with transglutaminase-like and TPR domain